jgi:hypothetical protein
MTNNNQKNIKYKNQSYQYPPKDKEILEMMNHPNYDGGSFSLHADASPLEKTKYDICRNIIRYKRENNLTREDIAEKIQLSPAETKRILLYRIDEFTLDRLITYASNLFFPLELGIVKIEPREKEYAKN